jgi:16S rRNA (guanine966-N2)-methyltransferase
MPRRSTRPGSALRIVGGALGGRRFGRPEVVTRPTSDRVREALASIVTARLELDGARVLELFAGTGACSFELLSRGAASAVLVERDPRAAADLEASAEALELTDRCTLVRAELGSARAFAGLPDGPFDVVIADPPYDRVGLALDVLGALADDGRIPAHGLVTLEHRSADAAEVDAALHRHATSSRLGDATSSRLCLVSRYRYGDSTISLLARDATGDSSDALPTPERADPSTDA